MLVDGVEVAGELAEDEPPLPLPLPAALEDVAVASLLPAVVVAV